MYFCTLLCILVHFCNKSVVFTDDNVQFSAGTLTNEVLILIPHKYNFHVFIDWLLYGSIDITFAYHSHAAADVWFIAAEDICRVQNLG
jgi:hypothetical protein